MLATVMTQLTSNVDLDPKLDHVCVLDKYRLKSIVTMLSLNKWAMHSYGAIIKLQRTNRNCRRLSLTDLKLPGSASPDIFAAYLDNIKP